VPAEAWVGLLRDQRQIVPRYPAAEVTDVHSDIIIENSTAIEIVRRWMEVPELVCRLDRNTLNTSKEAPRGIQASAI
jgi:hypothetical protein